MSNPMSSRRCECSRSAAKPASASCRPPSSSLPATDGAGPSIRTTSSAETSSRAATSPKIRSTPATARRTPVSALASSTPTLSTHPETTFVAVSSSAERASDGTITACAGRVIVIAVDAITAPA